jgi:hypothetical protein
MRVTREYKYELPIAVYRGEIFKISRFQDFKIRDLWIH